MIRSWIVALVALSAAGCSIGKHGESEPRKEGWERYGPGTLAAVIAQEKAQILSEGADPDQLAWNINAGDVSRRVIVEYQGEVRPLAVNVRELIERWNASVIRHSELPAMVQHEILVREGHQSYWIPIQKSLLSDLTTKCVKGDFLELLVVWVGSAKEDWVFLINGFIDQCNRNEPNISRFGKAEPARTRREGVKRSPASAFPTRVLN